MDVVDTGLLQRRAEIREEMRAGQNIYNSFDNYITVFLQSLPPHDAKRLIKEIKYSMHCYE